MTDWMNRTKALDRFTAQDRRMEKSERRIKELESALGELGGKLEDAVARLFPAPLEVQVDSEGRLVGGQPAPTPPRSMLARENPDAVHLFAEARDPKRVFCGFVEEAVHRSVTVLSETTCEACMTESMRAGMAAAKEPVIGVALPNRHKNEPDGVV